MPAPDAPSFYPPEPESLEQTGLPESLVEQLILKLLYFRGDLFGQDLSVAVGLKFSVIQDIVESLKLRHHLQIKRSLGVGNVSALLTLTESGRGRARDALETNQYAGPAPVPLEQYIGAVRKQKPVDGWLTKKACAAHSAVWCSPSRCSRRSARPSVPETPCSSMASPVTAKRFS